MPASPRFFLSLLRNRRRTLGLLGVAAAGGAILALLQMSLLAQLLVALLAEGRGLVELRWLLLTLALLIGFRALLSGWQDTFAARLAIEARSRLRARLLAKWTGPETNPLRAAPPATRATQAMEGVDRCAPWFSQFLPALVQMAVVPVLLALCVLLVDWRSGLILMVTGPMIPVLMAGIGIFTRKRSGDQLEALHRMSAHFHEVLRAFETLVIFGDERRTRARVASVARAFRTRTMRVLRLAFLSGFVLELAASLSIALVAISVGMRLLEGSIALGTALLVLLLAPEFYLPFRRVGARHHMAMEARAAARPLAMELEAGAPRSEDVALDRRAPTPRAAPPVLPATGIRIRDLRLRHPDAASDTLGPLDLELPSCGLFAVVGPSGAGKSTLFAGLMGFVAATGGRVEPALTRAHFAWVPQHPWFPDASVLDALRLADPALDPDTAAALLERATAPDLLPRLRDGQPLGEGARRLSGGQRQRLAIARALASHAPILLLDEPTSSLDDEGERAVLATLAALARERLILAITHRTPVAASADGVLLVRDGALRGPLAMAEIAHQSSPHTRRAPWEPGADEEGTERSSHRAAHGGQGAAVQGAGDA